MRICMSNKDEKRQLKMRNIIEKYENIIDIIDSLRREIVLMEGDNELGLTIAGYDKLSEMKSALNKTNDMLKDVETETVLC